MAILETKHAGGRKTDYDPAFCDEADVYLANCQDSYEEFHKTRGDKSDTYERIPIVRLPTYEGFSQHLGCSRDVLFDWSDRYPDFCAALNRIKTEQKRRLMEGGVAGTYNSTISKLILSANHQMNEKTETDFNVILPQPILDVTQIDALPANDSNQENPKIA